MNPLFFLLILIMLIPLVWSLGEVGMLNIFNKLLNYFMRIFYSSFKGSYFDDTRSEYKPLGLELPPPDAQPLFTAAPRENYPLNWLETLQEVDAELGKLREENKQLSNEIEKWGCMANAHLTTAKSYMATCDELRAANKKPKGNPFKVGQRARAYSLNSRYGSIIVGEIDEIDGDNILITEDGYPDDYNCNYWFHYKQCELIDE